jgi:alkylated DNA repair dioxygenase AlkB
LSQKQRIGGRECAYFGKSCYQYGSVNHRAAHDPHIQGLIQLLNSYFPIDINSALVNIYQDGNNFMPFHSDDEKCLGDDPLILSLSFGASRTFLIKGKKFPFSASTTLPSGSLLIMGGKMQRDYFHSIPKDINSKSPRVNITFRKIY